MAYIDNLANLARYNPFFGMKLSRRFFGERGHNSYSSNYGQTSKDGLHAPAEALFFYKWFPRDRHYSEVSDLSTSQMAKFKQTVHSLINMGEKPLVIKNLSFGLRLKVLQKVFPAARYIIVRRDPLYTAQSLLMAMRKHEHPEHKVWGILPKDHQQLEGLPPHEMVARQVNLIERQIHEDLENIPDANILYIDYEKLNDGLEGMLEEIKEFIGPATKKREGFTLPDIKVNRRITLPENEFTTLDAYIQKMNWELHKD